MPFAVGTLVVTTVVIPVAPASIVSTDVSEGVPGKEMRFHPGDKDISTVVPPGVWVAGVPSHFRHSANTAVGVGVTVGVGVGIGVGVGVGVGIGVGVAVATTMTGDVGVSVVRHSKGITCPPMSRLKAALSASLKFPVLKVVSNSGCENLV